MPSLCMSAIYYIKVQWDEVLSNCILHFEWAITASCNKKKADKDTIMRPSRFIDVFSCLFFGHHIT
jgi:hypothetical protein